MVMTENSQESIIRFEENLKYRLEQSKILTLLSMIPPKKLLETLGWVDRCYSPSWAFKKKARDSNQRNEIN